MTFQRTFNYGLVREIVTEPRLYRASVDDFSPAPADYVVNQFEAIWYVLVTEGAEYLGLFAFVPQNRICWDMHTCLLPCAWGSRTRDGLPQRGYALEAMRGVICWVFANTECRRVVGSAPAYNGLIIRLAERAGMKRFGVNEKSFLRDGVLHDQILLGISETGIIGGIHCPS